MCLEQSKLHARHFRITTVRSVDGVLLSPFSQDPIVHADHSDTSNSSSGGSSSENAQCIAAAPINSEAGTSQIILLGV
jgi:hypothetical protein